MEMYVKYSGILDIYNILKGFILKHFIKLGLDNCRFSFLDMVRPKRFILIVWGQPVLLG